MSKIKSREKTNPSFFKKPKVCIGVDQSYTCTGIAIAVEGEVKVAKFFPLKNKTQPKTVKREIVGNAVRAAIRSCLKHYNPENICIIVERIRTFSQSFTGMKNMSMPFIKAQAALVAKIVDVAYYEGITNIYSVDTRAWKTKILGTSKPLAIEFPGVYDPKKIREVKWFIENYPDLVDGIIHKGTRLKYNDDAVDAACISLYAFAEPPIYLVKEE